MHSSFRRTKSKVEVKAWGGLVLHDIHTRALKRATEILGGEDKLRIFLGATELDFSAWLNEKELPRNIFLRLVDVITDEDVRRLAGVVRR
jgi:hypothetical protein